jgi:hypothetical protein
MEAQVYGNKKHNINNSNKVKSEINNFYTKIVIELSRYIDNIPILYINIGGLL